MAGMRRVWGIFVIAVLGWATPASAQFANKSLGLEVGWQSLQAPSEGIHDGAVPIGLTGSLYLDEHFELEAHAGALIYKYAGADAYRVGLDVGLGIRYLFLEENIRPYIGFEIAPLFLLSDTSTTTTDSNGDVIANPNYAQGATPGSQNIFLGLSPMVGCEFFVSTSISIGIRAQFDAYLSLNIWGGYSIGVTPYVAAYF